MTLTPAGPPTGAPAPRRRRSRVPLRLWLLALLVGILVLLTATSGVREWWAHRLHDMTGGSTAANVAIGVLVGLLPLIGVAIGSLGAVGHRRLVRMLMFGAVGFVATFLLSPSPAAMLSDNVVHHVFDRNAPGYLAGVLVGEATWLAALALAWWRVRQWRRRRFGVR